MITFLLGMLVVLAMWLLAIHIRTNPTWVRWLMEPMTTGPVEGYHAKIARLIREGTEAGRPDADRRFRIMHVGVPDSLSLPQRAALFDGLRDFSKTTGIAVMTAQQAPPRLDTVTASKPLFRALAGAALLACGFADDHDSIDMLIAAYRQPAAHPCAEWCRGQGGVMDTFEHLIRVAHDPRINRES